MKYEIKASKNRNRGRGKLRNKGNVVVFGVIVSRFDCGFGRSNRTNLDLHCRIAFRTSDLSRRIRYLG
jgi:hypothetical protein